MIVITLRVYVQNVPRWLTHMPAVACGSLSRRCQWISPVRQTKAAQVHFELGNCLFLASVAACDKTPPLRPNPIIQWIQVRLLLVIGDETRNL